MPSVLNRHKIGHPKNAVYIGRGTKWGNPSEVGSKRTKAQALQDFRDYLAKNPWLVAQAKAELRGKDLLCSCAPADCHGDILLEIANAD